MVTSDQNAATPWTNAEAFTERRYTSPHEDHYVETLRSIRVEAGIPAVSYAEDRAQKLTALRLNAFCWEMSGVCILFAIYAAVFAIGGQ